MDIHTTMGGSPQTESITDVVTSKFRGMQEEAAHYRQKLQDSKTAASKRYYEKKLHSVMAKMIQLLTVR